jgi:hypothetical protein
LALRINLRDDVLDCGRGEVFLRNGDAPLFPERADLIERCLENVHVEIRGRDTLEQRFADDGERIAAPPIQDGLQEDGAWEGER